MNNRRPAIPEGLETITFVGRDGEQEMICALARLHSAALDRWYKTSKTPPFQYTSRFNLQDFDDAHITIFINWCMQYSAGVIWDDDVVGLVRLADFLLASRFQAYVMECVTSTLAMYLPTTLAALVPFARDRDLSLIIMHLHTNIRLIIDITELVVRDVMHWFRYDFKVLSVLVGCNTDALSTDTKQEIARALIRSTGRSSLSLGEWWADNDKCQWVLGFMASNNEWSAILRHCARSKTDKSGLFIRQSLKRISLHRRCKGKEQHD